VIDEEGLRSELRARLLQRDDMQRVPTDQQIRAYARWHRYEFTSPAAMAVADECEFFPPPPEWVERAMTAFVIAWTMFAGLVLLLATAAEVRGVP
jgi:hypothetical protein